MTFSPKPVPLPPPRVSPPTTNPSFMVPNPETRTDRTYAHDRDHLSATTTILVVAVTVASKAETDPGPRLPVAGTLLAAARAATVRLSDLEAVAMKIPKPFPSNQALLVSLLAAMARTCVGLKANLAAVCNFCPLPMVVLSASAESAALLLAVPRSRMPSTASLRTAGWVR